MIVYLAKMIALIESHFLPSLDFFCAILPYKNIVLERWEYFEKQTYRNRCYINTAQGVKMLTVPLANRHGKLLTHDVQIEAGKGWRNKHWRTIESAYRKAPFFEHYADALKSILFYEHEFLFDFNHALLSFCLNQIGLERTISASVSYELNVNENVCDLRSLISNKKPNELKTFYTPINYYQIFGSEFAPNLSLIDLLFCEGPQTLSILKSSQRQQIVRNTSR